MSYVCTIKINKEMKNLNNTYSLFNNPSLLGADKVWYNLLKSRKTDYDGI